MAIKEIRVTGLNEPIYNRYRRIIVSIDGYHMDIMCRVENYTNILKQLNHIDFNVITDVVDYMSMRRLFEFRIFTKITYSCAEIQKAEEELFGKIDKEAVVSVTFTPKSTEVSNGG